MVHIDEGDNWKLRVKPDLGTAARLLEVRKPDVVQAAWSSGTSNLRYHMDLLSKYWKKKKVITTIVRNGKFLENNFSLYCQPIFIFICSDREKDSHVLYR